MATWTPSQSLSAELLASIQQAIDRIPLAHLLPLTTGELLNPEQAYERLQNYAFSQGFCIVKVSYDKTNEISHFAYIHYSKKTRNYRKLDDYVVLERHMFQGKGLQEKAWFLGITNDSYGNTHDIVPNPLFYYIHAQRQLEYAIAIQQALALRSAQIPHTQANRVLHSQDLQIGKKTYYNLERNYNSLKEEGELTTMITYLEDQCFHIRSQYIIELDSATTQLSRKRLEQIFFLSDTQIALSQRYCLDFMIQIDTTFNTNSQQFPLTIVTGVSNTGITFPLAFSFISSEDKVSMQFILESLNELSGPLQLFSVTMLPRVMVVNMVVHFQFSSVFHADTGCFELIRKAFLYPFPLFTHVGGSLQGLYVLANGLWDITMLHWILKIVI
ncbi:MAG: hypothetical protein M1813_002394 [Trichoglossum hirsutum]|nr:MAG: hypothetical protein M1813_002394 [Trichoglossum hirsutum]